MKLRSSGLFAVFLLAGSITPAQQTPALRPITVDDLFGVKEPHEAQIMTDTIQDGEEFEWAPDGKQLVLVLRDPTPEELEAAARKTKGSEDGAGKKSKAQPPWVIDRLQFKNDNVGYIDRRRTHLYVFNMAAKTQRQVTPPHSDDSAPAWWPPPESISLSTNPPQT